MTTALKHETELAEAYGNECLYWSMKGEYDKANAAGLDYFKHRDRATKLRIELEEIRILQHH